MEIQNEMWSDWCRLCAKDDPANINYTVTTDALAEDMKHALEDVMEKLCWLGSPDEDLPVTTLCTECYSLIMLIIRFSQRVHRVQQMYKFLKQRPIEELCDLKSIRFKFDVLDEDEKHAQTELINLASYSRRNDCKEDLIIKKEDCMSEEMAYDEECHSVGIGDEVIDPFKPDDVQHSKTSPAIEAKYDTSCDSKSLDITTSNHQKRRRKRRTREEIRQDNEASKCRNKELSGKDFPLEVSCSDCAENFSLYSTYYKHLKLKHAKTISTNSWKCPFCESTLHTRDSFRRHMRLHVPADRLHIKCPKCDNRYLTNGHLEKHLKQRHSNEKPYICEECGMRSTTLGNLKQHMVTHSDLMPYECELCKKSFKSVIQLKRHLDTHGINKYACTICNLQLKSRTTLKRHYLVHTDKMQHKCDYCGRAFKRSKTLKTHLLLHTGLKPYSCDFCERTFANGSNCRSHMKKMHPVELAALEASGGKVHAQNLPKLENLKTLTQTTNR